MSIEIQQVEVCEIPIQTRIPFRYGITTVREVNHVIIQLTASIDGEVVQGTAAENLMPRWFIKDKLLTISKEYKALIAVIKGAITHIKALRRGESVFELWSRLYELQKITFEQTYPPLLWSLGISLLERALIDAYCRATKTTFHQALITNAFGIDLAFFYPELSGVHPQDFIPAKPIDHILVRHTIGLADPLEEENAGLKDGLPWNLQEIVQTYGLSYFKIKLSGELEWDRSRLESIQGILRRDCNKFYITLDGNENFKTMSSFQRYWNDLIDNDHMKQLLEHLLYIEQPVARMNAFLESVDSKLPSIIIDEADGELTSYKHAISCGYRGVSHKNCKGVLKSVANLALQELYMRQGYITGEYQITSEDLSSIGPYSLLQDLAVAASLGIIHTERNGHHYFKGLNMFPDDLEQNILELYPDLYERHEDGFAKLSIRMGAISLGHVNQSPFGCRLQYNIKRLETVQYSS
ncbi:hypothetical protein [Paenibacillus sp. PL2-23]|uniref:hypothetical protein n=1 Tax=Paenibacillus sp. PL2-23 TaxID=2100729 RepID=UPI0030F83BC6